MSEVLILTVGLPRSGKSTWAKEQGYPIVSPDAIRLALHGTPYMQSIEPFVWAIAETMVNALFLAGNEIVIVDATNTTRKRRDFWRKDGRDVVCKEFNTTWNVCVERAMATNQEHLILVIKRMFHAYDNIEEDEGNYER